MTSPSNNKRGKKQQRGHQQQRTRTINKTLVCKSSWLFHYSAGTCGQWESSASLYLRLRSCGVFGGSWSHHVDRHRHRSCRGCVAWLLQNWQGCWYGFVMVDLGVVAKLYVLTCEEVLFSISFHYVRSITFASYDVCGFPCASKCVVNVYGLTRLKKAKVL